MRARVRIFGLVAAALAALSTAGRRSRAGRLASTAPTFLFTTLTGKRKSGAGDEDGFGAAAVVLRPRTNQVCFALAVAKIAPATLAHIHNNPAGVNGPVVVDFIAPTNGFSFGCAKDVSDALLTDIRDNPAELLRERAQHRVPRWRAPRPARLSELAAELVGTLQQRPALRVGSGGVGGLPKQCDRTVDLADARGEVGFRGSRVRCHRWTSSPRRTWAECSLRHFSQ